MDKTEIIEFFDEYIFGFIYSDIEKGIKSGANYLVALGLLSYSEFIGGLLTGKSGISSESESNFNAFQEKYLSYEYETNYYCDFQITIAGTPYPNSVRGKQHYALYTIFRCGLVHEYFIKGNNTVIANSLDNKANSKAGIYWKEVFDEDSGKKIEKMFFHTNNYFRDFKKAVNSYFENLLIDTTLQGNLKNSLNNLNKSISK